MIGRDVAYRKTDKSDLCWSAFRSKRGSCSSGGVWHTAKRDYTGYYPSTVYCLAPASTGYCLSTVDLLQPPPATVHPRRLPHASTSYCSSTGSCSSSLNRLLFNQPSTGSCSSTPNRLNRGPVHPAAMTSTTTGSCSSNPHRELFFEPQPHTSRLVQPQPPRSLFIKRQQVRSTSVSSSSEGIARSGSVTTRDRSIARVR